MIEYATLSLWSNYPGNCRIAESLLYVRERYLIHIGATVFGRFKSFSPVGILV
jgi:hypothetical protein